MEIDPYYWSKCTYEKVTKDLGRALLPPSFGKKSKRTAVFFSWERPLLVPYMHASWGTMIEVWSCSFLFFKILLWLKDFNYKIFQTRTYCGQKWPLPQQRSCSNWHQRPICRGWEWHQTLLMWEWHQPQVTCCQKWHQTQLQTSQSRLLSTSGLLPSSFFWYLSYLLQNYKMSPMSPTKYTFLWSKN